MRSPENSEYGEPISRFGSMMDRVRGVKANLAERAAESFRGSVESGRAEELTVRAIDVAARAAEGALPLVPGVGVVARFAGRRVIGMGAEAARGRVPEALSRLSDRFESSRSDSDSYPGESQPQRPVY